jgi:hypothetical protein
LKQEQWKVEVTKINSESLKAELFLQPGTTARFRRWRVTCRVRGALCAKRFLSVYGRLVDSKPLLALPQDIQMNKTEMIENIELYLDMLVHSFDDHDSHDTELDHHIFVMKCLVEFLKNKNDDEDVLPALKNLIEITYVDEDNYVLVSFCDFLGSWASLKTDHED